MPFREAGAQPTVSARRAHSLTFHPAPRGLTGLARPPAAGRAHDGGEHARGRPPAGVAAT